MIENIFKKKMPFNKAIEALVQGNRVRRKDARKGYAKMIIIEGKRQQETYGTYWASSDDISDHCSFSLDNVLATDWIIDE